MVANGLAMPLPAMSGAEPWIGSYKPHAEEFREADGNIQHVVVSFLIDPQGRITRRYFGLDHDTSDYIRDLSAAVRG